MGDMGIVGIVGFFWGNLAFCLVGKADSIRPRPKGHPLYLRGGK